MPKSREEINQTNYLRRKEKILKGMCSRTRSNKKTPSREAVLGQLVRKAKKADAFVNEANLEEHGWQVFRGVWTKYEADAAVKNVNKISKTLNPVDYNIRGDKKRLSVPFELISKTHADRALEKTALCVSGNPTKKRVIGIVSFPGAVEQNDHVDTVDKKAISVLHALTSRYFHVGIHLIKLNAGDVIAFKGGVCHKGASNNSTFCSIALHVPVGFDNNNFTSPC